MKRVERHFTRRPSLVALSAGYRFYDWDWWGRLLIRLYDYSLAPARPKPLAPDPDNPPGPTVVPGTYGVDLTADGKTRSAKLTVVKDPRLATTPEQYAAQYALHRELVASLSKLKSAVNRLRKAKHQLEDVAQRGKGALRTKAVAIGRKLSEIEKVMVDPHRKSVRDVLPNIEDQYNQIKDLDAPDDDAQAIVDGLGEAVEKGKDNPASLTTEGNTAFADVNAKAKAYGLTNCGNGS